MKANIKRSKYTSEGWIYNSTVFKIYAELELTPEEHHLIERAGLNSRIIFDSADAEYYKNASSESVGKVGYNKLNTGDKEADIFFGALTSVFTSIYYVGEAAYNAIQWSSSLQITVQSLLDGTEFESENIDEVAQAESIIRAAIDQLKNYVETLSTYDGQDNVFEPE